MQGYAYDLLTPFGVRPGQVTDEAKINAEITQGDASRQAAQAELAARLGIAKMGNDTQRYGIDKQLEGTGTFGQRSAHEGSMFARGATLQRDLDRSSTERAFGTVDRQMAPSLMEQKRLQDVHDEETPLRKARSGMQLGAMERLQQAFSGGVQSSPISGDQIDLLSLQAAIANGGAIPDVSGRSAQREIASLQLAEIRRQIAEAKARSQAEAGDPAAARITASEGGGSIAIPTVDEFLSGAGASAKSGLEQRAKTFGARDRAWFTADPSSEDEEAIVRAVTTLANDIKRKTGVTIEEAMQRAQEIVNDAMSQADVDYKDDFGADRTAELLKRIAR